MSLFKESETGNFLFTPPIGKFIKFIIAGQINRVKNSDGNSDLNYKLKDKSNAGYYDTMDVVTDDGEEKKLIINTWKIYFLFKEMNDTLNIGDEITINHIGQGDYTVEKV